MIESRAAGFAAGDYVWHAAGWRDYATVRAGEPALGGLGTLARIDVEAAPPQAYLGALGGIGLTAYVGLLDVAGAASRRRRLGIRRGRRGRRASRRRSRSSRVTA